MLTPCVRTPYEACPLCDGQEATHVITAECSGHALYQPSLPATQRWVRCVACQHVFTDGYFGEAALAVLFSGAHPHQVPGHDVAGGRAVSAEIVRRVTDLLHPGGAEQPGRWLDVGFGNGALLTTAAEFGYEVCGVDTRRACVDRLREFGFAAWQGDFLRFSAPDGRGFDVLSLADVLEHMPFPRTALRHARDLLREGGLLFVSMPNLDSFQWQHMDATRQNPYWAELEHYHNFGRRRLHALLRESGFSPCSYDISRRYLACMEVVARRD